MCVSGACEGVTCADLWERQLYWWLCRLASSTFSSVSTWPKRSVSWVSLQITQACVGVGPGKNLMAVQSHSLPCFSPVEGT
ncbi:unnamed protein product [Boreogadus saida]